MLRRLTMRVVSPGCAKGTRWASGIPKRGRFSRLVAPRGIAVFVATIWSLGVCDIWAANHVTRSARGRVTFVLRWLAVHLAGVFSDELRSFTADGFLRSSRELQARHKALRNGGAEIIPVRMRHPHKW
jgi:hypothetical protein